MAVLLWFILMVMRTTMIHTQTTKRIWGIVMEREHVPLYAYRIEAPHQYWKYEFNQQNMLPKRPPDLTPDWKLEEIPPEPYSQSYYGEFERPYKLQPFTISAAYWDASYNNFDHPQLLGCYCCTVYRMVNPLAGCAVLTTRHILTTATSTELVLKDYGDKPNLEGILGAWYDISLYKSNNSVYMTPARIHYHPQYIMPENVNASHPIPGVFDLAVWASTYPFYRYVDYWYNQQTYVCNRAGSYWIPGVRYLIPRIGPGTSFHRSDWHQTFQLRRAKYTQEIRLVKLQFGSPTLGAVKQPVAIIVGFQFIMWFKRKPLPFYKYAVKTQKYTRKCPKTEWGWFFCVWGRWAMFGLDSGAALHRATQGQSWLYDGLLGMNAFSMDLRAKDLTHYFTPVENHSVLTFLYDAYMGRIAFRWLDDRYTNTEWQAPLPHSYVKITWSYNFDPTKWDVQFDPPTFYKK